MQYKDELVLDFARRTLKNLEFVEQYAAGHSQEPDIQVYEVTQLINSMMGLLVFPQQRLYESIPETPLSVLLAEGFPEIHPKIGRLRQDTLRQLLRYLRNGISHFNVRFISDEHHHLSGLEVWNIPTGEKHPDWVVELTLEQLKAIVIHFVRFIEDFYGEPHRT